MSKPISFYLAGFKWEIRYLKHQDWPTDEHDANGLTHGDQMLIQVRTSDELGKYNVGRQKLILFHELLHACYIASGLNFNTFAEEKDKQEEYTITLLSHPLLAVMRENPDLAEWLLG